jgi:hypothetical protein
MLQKIKINDLQCNFAYLTLSSFQFFFFDGGSFQFC